ncbi:divalent-cation tolerance protein CutA [Kordiimonas sp. SCSIO 12610]|uniref:divalent-cation tolerance protein CutA n=1 Tax=Kordiimonas sp. SCSIO 12610 TaxID=2829597 RepID=UPI00210AB732|nr:divalent-cation tolerance protein CutA [Kordiimonas sp. SCSIO 12610]UTW53903.1 divalent-cation tolerance protein CutA [Kordiimonas sp. SCSIO 12610]
MDDIVTIYTLTDSEDVAVHLATTLVREKLIACANVGQSVRSVYEWNGTIQLEGEVPLFIKTSKHLSELVIERIKELHTYEVPCITVWPMIGGNEVYATWVKGQVLNPETEAYVKIDADAEALE